MAVRLLVADDSIFIRDIIRHHFERIGCKVIAEAENASQALNLFRTLQPELVTLDLVMPQVDGVDSLAAFRTMRKEAPAIPILVVSAMPFEESRETFMAEGALDYIVKPFNRFGLEQVRRKLEAMYPELKTANGDSAYAGRGRA